MIEIKCKASHVVSVIATFPWRAESSMLVVESRAANQSPGRSRHVPAGKSLSTTRLKLDITSSFMSCHHDSHWPCIASCLRPDALRGTSLFAHAAKFLSLHRDTLAYQQTPCHRRHGLLSGLHEDHSAFLRGCYQRHGLFWSIIEALSC